MEKVIDRLGQIGMPRTHEDMEYIEHRVYHDYVGTVDNDIRDPSLDEGSYDKSWLPYEQDYS